MMGKQGVRIKPPHSHGTDYAYRKHLWAGEKPCEECLVYNRQRMAVYRRRKAQQRWVS